MNPSIYFIIFAVIAFLLFAMEVFVPGGIIGAMGVVSLLAACWFAVTAFGTAVGLVVSLVLILLTLVGFMIWLIKMPDTRIGRRFSLESSLESARSAEDDDSLVGLTGLAECDLRPSGYARFDGRKIDVVAARGYISKGQSVIITEVHGSRIVVRRADSASS